MSLFRRPESVTALPALGWVILVPPPPREIFPPSHAEAFEFVRALRSEVDSDGNPMEPLITADEARLLLDTPTSPSQRTGLQVLLSDMRSLCESTLKK